MNGNGRSIESIVSAQYSAGAHSSEVQLNG